MPKGLPSAEQLMSGTVNGFSIDTCIFESLGFNLDSGELGVLRQQLPPWLRLYIPSIVSREVIAHQVANVRKAEQELKTSIRNIHRYSGLDLSSVSRSVDLLPLENVSSVFENRLKEFVSKFNGEILKEGGAELLHEMFERYFNSQPPFESKKDKKHEFPDAAALLALNEVWGWLILVSNDEGWLRFCEQSPSMFCVKSIEELTDLYQTDSQVTEKIAVQVKTALADPHSKLSQQIEDDLEEVIPNCSWIVDAYTGYCERIDAELTSAEFRGFDLDVRPFRQWLSNNEQEICVIEFDLVVTCKFEVAAKFSTWDSFDREYCPVGTGSKTISSEIPMTVYLTLDGDLSNGDIGAWEIRFELSQQDYSVEAGEMVPDYQDYEE